MPKETLGDGGDARSDVPIVSGAVVAVVYAILGIVTAVSFATLVFGESTPEYLGAGIAHFLLGGGVAGIMLATISTIRGQLGGIQDVSAAIAGAIAASVAASLQNADGETVFANVLVAMISATVLTGLFFAVLGRFHLGNLVRFVPFPVMAGFLAATGWLLFKGGLEVSGGSHLEMLHIDYFWGHAHLDRAALALTLGIVFYFLAKRYESRFWVAPAAIIGSIAVFYSLVAMFEPTLGEIQSHEWLIGPLPETSFWEMLTIPNLSLVEGDVIGVAAGGIFTVVVVSAIAVMVTESGLELAMARDIDVNEELERTGLVNLVTGLTGAPASWVESSSTAHVDSEGVRNRAVGLTYGLLILAALVVGSTAISLFPRFVAGAVLVYLALELLSQWLIDARKQMPIIDYLVAVSIVVVVEVFGLLPGIGAGLVASIVIFAVRYATLQPIKASLDIASVRSGRDRSIPDERLLSYHSDKVLILQMQGFIFFGTAYTVYRHIKTLMTNKTSHPLFLILDLRLVQGIDSSATTTFSRSANLLSDMGAELLIIPGSEELAKALSSTGVSPERYSNLHIFEQFSDAIEWCEDKVLEVGRAQLQSRESSGADAEFLEAVFGDVMSALDVQEEFEEVVRLLGTRLEAVETTRGEILFVEREENTKLYFVVTGSVGIERQAPSGNPLTLRTLGPWNIVGSLGAVLGDKELFSARVVKPGQILALDRSDLEALPDQDAELAQRLQLLTLRMMGNELATASRSNTQG